MDEATRWEYLCRLDEELLRGGVVLSEWCAFIVREADTAFCRGAHLATVLLVVSAIETHLRAECLPGKRNRLVALIEDSSLPADLKFELHALRKYRNRWVHIEEPWEDDELLDDTVQAEQELAAFALSSIRALRRTLYANSFT